MTCVPTALALVFLALVAQHAAAVPSTGLSEGQLQDRDALMALKAAVANNGWGSSKMRSWKAQGNPCSPKPWPHVTCWSNRVVGISLANLNVQATLPLKLRQMNELITLDLEGNRFTGTVPDGWADPRYFLKLRTLDLHGNQLTGTLPNAKWNRKGAFKSLQTMDLSENTFYGGLPIGWLSTNRVFRMLKYLDLSKNLLGTKDGVINADGSYSAQYGSTAEWCPEASSAFGSSYRSLGWCPGITTDGTGLTPDVSKPLPGTMQQLVTLDLSDNALKGSLPPKWPVLFPNLQFLLLANNELYADKDVPAPLPKAWTQPTYPIAFPALSVLVLYPGNDNICFLPDFDATSFASSGYDDVNADHTYRLLDSQTEEEYTPMNPWRCHSPAADNPPASVALKNDGGKLLLVWEAPTDNADAVFGYKITMYTYIPATDEFQLMQSFNGRVYRTYLGGSFTEIPADWGLKGSGAAGDPYVLPTNVVAQKDIKYRVEITTYNLDGQDSDYAEWEDIP